MDEELLSRQQPQSLEAEQAVLGSMLIDSRCIPDVVEHAEAGGLLPAAEPGNI